MSRAFQLHPRDIYYAGNSKTISSTAILPTPKNKKPFHSIFQENNEIQLNKNIPIVENIFIKKVTSLYEEHKCFGDKVLHCFKKIMFECIATNRLNVVSCILHLF